MNWCIKKHVSSHRIKYDYSTIKMCFLTSHVSDYESAAYFNVHLLLEISDHT
jgi:hypothetical protein